VLLQLRDQLGRAGNSFSHVLDSRLILPLNLVQSEVSGESGWITQHSAVHFSPNGTALRPGGSLNRAAGPCPFRHRAMAEG
jgi:hypothetical protein